MDLSRNAAAAAAAQSFETQKPLEYRVVKYVTIGNQASWHHRWENWGMLWGLLGRDIEDDPCVPSKFTKGKRARRSNAKRPFNKTVRAMPTFPLKIC